MQTDAKKSDAGAGLRAAIALAVTVGLTALAIFMSGDAAYPWVKAVHVIAVIAWMAGMLYLPRLFVYHAEAKAGSELSETLKIMERRLLKIIINPAMIITWALGLWLAWSGGWFHAPWLHGKLLLVVALTVVHGILAKATRLFAEDRNTRSTRFYRILNEVPAVLMIGIVILVIVKPF
jgi:protoporphyrinogen IX oxidase